MGRILNVCSNKSIVIKSFRIISLTMLISLKAIADLIYCVIGLPVIAAELINNRHWNLGLFGCKIVSTIILINLYGSVYFLSTISIGMASQKKTTVRIHRLWSIGKTESAVKRSMSSNVATDSSTSLQNKKVCMVASNNFLVVGHRKFIASNCL